MRIGIDCRTILDPKGGERAGIGHYTYFLVKSLLQVDHHNEYVLFFDSNVHELLEFIEPNDRVVTFPFMQYRKFLPFIYSHILMSAAIKKEKLDVYHAPANSIPLYYNGASVVTVHDLAIYKHPQWFPAGQDFAVKKVVPASLKKAKKIIVVSHATKRDVIEQFHIPPERITVIYEGAPTEEKIMQKQSIGTPDTIDISGRLIVSISTLEPRKNFVRLIKAFQRVLEKNKERYKDVKLIIAGAPGWKYEEIIQAIEKFPYKNQLHYLGYISHEEKIQLLQRATLFAFPTLWEGFGIGNLEACAQGVPVVTSRIAPVEEILGDAAYLVHPESVDEIARGLQTMIDDEKRRHYYAEKGKQRAKLFSWKKCVKETLMVYEEVGKAYPTNIRK